MSSQDVEPGQCVRPQLASRANDVQDAFRKIGGKSFLVELKFDGERIQVRLSNSW